ncbi:MAG TPA: hypothetical protein VL022_07415 [Moheibacter sp.]|nr:hypothetical protein [Moheibacter sp.]
MGTFFKYLLYLVLAFFVFRFLNRIFSPRKAQAPKQKSGFQQEKTKNLDEPQYKIEAESVDYEILEEPRDKDEK